MTPDEREAAVQARALARWPTAPADAPCPADALPCVPWCPGRRNSICTPTTTEETHP